jgi:hypothetical protein
LPNPVNEVRALAFNSSNGNIFAGIYGGGVFRSTNNGDNWNPVNTGLINPDVFALAINSNGHIFAGTIGGGVFRSTDNGDNWNPINTGLTNTSIVTLAINDVGIIFAGTSSSGVFRSMDNSDNSGSWTRVNIGLTDPKPSARESHAMAYIGSKQALLFGGNSGSGPDNETWVYDLSGSAWTQKAPATKPSARLYHTMAYLGGDQALLFGGSVASSANDETWVYDLSDNTWTLRSPATKPSARFFHAMAHIGGDQVLLFSGNDGSFGPNETWVFAKTMLAVTTNAATNIKMNSATLNGIVNPQNLSTSVKFEYGTTTSYGNEVTATPSPINGTNPVAVSADLTGLTPGTAYHFRLVAANSAGTTNGTDMTFITNRPPTVANAISNQTLTAGGTSFTRDLNAATAVFSDPDGEALTYTANSNATSIATANITGSTLAVKPTAVGTATITVTADDGREGILSTSFTVTVAAVNQPPVIALAALLPQPAGQDIIVQANLTDDGGIAGAALHYRQGGEQNFTMAAMSNTGGNYRGIISANAATSRGVEYFIVATDAGNLTSRAPATGVVSIQIQVSNQAPGNSQPHGSAQTAYRLISVPIDLDNKSPQAVLEDDLGKYDDTK